MAKFSVMVSFPDRGGRADPVLYPDVGCLIWMISCRVGGKAEAELCCAVPYGKKFLVGDCGTVMVIWGWRVLSFLFPKRTTVDWEG